MKSYNTYEDNEVKYNFILSEKEAYILRSILYRDVLDKNNRGHSRLRYQICMDIIKGIEEGYDKHRYAIENRDMECVKKEYEMRFR